jgi:LuxR family maltose regulon positive regulatory protein
MLGNLDDAKKILQEAVQVGRMSGNILVAVGALSNVAGLLLNSGEFTQAQELYTQAMQIARDPEGNLLPIAGKALMGLGEIAREQKDLKAAEQHISQAIELLQYLGEGGIVVAYLTLSRIRYAVGDIRTAFEFLEQAQALALQSAGTELDDILVAIQIVRMKLAQGNLDAVADWIEERELDRGAIVGTGSGKEPTSTPFTLLRLAEFTTFVRVLIAQERLQEAGSVLDYCLSIAQGSNQMRRVVECLILQADIHHRRGKLDSAVLVMEKALVLAEKHGYFRIFLDEGDEIAHVLYEVSKRGIMKELTGKLLAAFRSTEVLPKMPSSTTIVDIIVEPLSEREMDVVRLIAQGLSNQEIAQKLVLSLSTVKWHCGNIYSKLGVKNRMQAVAKVKQLGILDVE